MSDKRSHRREASRKPSLAAVIYKFDKAKETSNATPQEYREALNVIHEPIGPLAITREIDKAINEA